MEIDVEIFKVNDTEYVTVRGMATLVNRSDQTIYNLTSKGNAIRKMKHMKIGKQVLIPISEVKEFPFTIPGKQTPNSIYRYVNEGN